MFDSGCPRPGCGEAHTLQNVEGETVTITWKTWFVIFILSSTFGLSFWPVPTTAAMMNRLSVQFGAPTSRAWYVPAYTTANSIGFLLAGANSDLFGRRLFLLFGNACCCVGFIVTATSNTANHFTAGLAVTGFGGGFAQMAMCSIPELLPNKFRHIGICLSDGFVFLIVIIGPIVGRYAIDVGAWRYVYWAGLVAQFLSFTALFIFYKPPKHPKGVPWHEAIKGLDYVGTALIVPGICLALVGIIQTTYKPSSDVTVIAPMVVGFIMIVAFGVWETVSNTRFKLCPPHLFRSHKGREFTAPFIVAFIVTMFYYSVNIIWPTMVNVFYLKPDTSRRTELLLTLPPNVGLVFGSMCLIAFGNLLGHWKLTLIITWTGMVFFGALMGLVTPFNQGLMIAFCCINASFFGWAQYESIAFTQLGVPQQDLGFSGGLAGMARYAGGSLAQAIYTTILTNAQSTRAAATVPAAAIAEGMSSENAQALFAAVPLGAAAIAEVPGTSMEAISAASLAYQWSYAHALKIVALSSLSFGIVGLLCAFWCEDLTPKMTDKVEVFLENDVYADKNEFH
ncbi:MFS general substrate transporter [Cucurbitaria berberidis CBS 394.84]|uniref:MFS general substrate transporter n=1 Tax=Cucurbitaria berberidis CBS 394.84 TaxID=1168544 RepID=A0A9P4L8N0_9PLEO|nr:MFS general substrate transporter [Cucurbitaria berberidis CBS 394.84]KAF1846276.1 MFS general substrate transporter [Cucurbitaria berberidis CBS 394.84]